MPDDPKETLARSVARVEKLVSESFCLGADGAPLPSWIEISPIDRCNRKCSFCPKSDESVAPDQALEMPPALYGKIADDLALMGFKGTVMLAGYGEPLLARNILAMTVALSQVCRVEITTNGDVLSTGKARSLIEAGASKLVVSLYDGPDQVAAFHEIFAQAGVPQDKYVLRDRWYGADQDFGVMLTNRAGTVTAGNQRQVSCGQCFYPHYYMMIDWNGDVFLCPQDWNRRIKMGNVVLESVHAVWTSRLYRRHRLNLIDGHRSLHPCIKCNATGTLHGEVHAQAWSALYAASAAAK